MTQITTGGGTGDYDDLVFQVMQSASPARVSEPASLVLLCAGLICISQRTGGGQRRPAANPELTHPPTVKPSPLSYISESDHVV